jgi:hypothetical protein
MLLDEPGLDFNPSNEWMNPEPAMDEMPLIGPGGCFPGGQEWGTGWGAASGEVSGGGGSMWDFGSDWDLANMGIGQAWELGSGLF